MENNILVELLKKVSYGYEKTIIYKNGAVEFEILKNGEITKELKVITIIDDLTLQLERANGIINLIYGNESVSDYKIIYNNQTYYSLDLYIDILMMVKHDQIKKLSVFSQYEKKKKEIEKEQKKVNDIIFLNEMENNKMTINVDDIEIGNFDNERKIISFELEDNSNFELGQSRFFSDTIDIADDIEIPHALDFVGQLNLKELSQYDINKMLPSTGILYFFQSPMELDGHFYEFGKVIYSDNMNIKRKSIEVNERNKHMMLNFSLKEITNSIEDYNKRYYEYNGERCYDSFVGEDLNKIGGFYTDCQMSDEDIKKTSLKYVVLLQLGSDIYGEGITTFLIPEEDLKIKNFNNIIFTYVQS